MIYVVLGMHKSGTTLISQTLHNSGVAMGEAFDARVSYDSGNKYEREATLALNMDILGLDSYVIRDVPAPSAVSLTPEQERRMLAIIGSCSASHKDWGFKDPRTTLVYPLWRDRLPPHRVIAIYREPEELWPRFRQGGIRRQYRNPIRAWQYLSRWYEHNQRLLDYLRHPGCDGLLLSYREFMGGTGEFERLRAFVGRDLVDMRRPSLYRGRRRRYPLVVLAAWLMEKLTDRSPRALLRRLDSLREEQVRRAGGGSTGYVAPGGSLAAGAPG
jgi:hypothetical protein